MDRRYKKKMAAYWIREKNKSLESLDRLDFSSWFDYWHLHPDWYAKGNRFSEDRRSVALSTWELLLHAEQRLKSRKSPYQVWATICANTADNAIYIHTENKNNTAYPHEFEEITWSVSPPKELENLVDMVTHRLGKVVYEFETVYIITANA